MLFDRPIRLYPKVKLPEMTSDDALVIASGPSFDDFNISDIQACRATKYGAGQVYQFVDLDHYFLIDNMPYVDPTRDMPTRAKVWTSFTSTPSKKVWFL